MLWTSIHIIDILLWLVMAGSVAYVLFFAVVSMTGKESSKPTADTDSKDIKDFKHSFLIIFPAYGEDSVIYQSVSTCLRQDYPSELFDIVVVSDHMKQETDAMLGKLPVKLMKPAFDKSSKAKALQFAINNTIKDYDRVVILDADNIVGADFLTQLNASCSQGYKAIQCHRCAKNSDNDIAMLDGISEEINNTLFRKAHNRIGLSSALIGSGMCFDYQWFRSNVHNLLTAGEDRELEALLIWQGIYIKYEESIHVRDEKVSNKDNFQRQRQRWMSAQLNCLCSMLPHLPAAIIRRNVNFIDKTVQQMLLPRSILVAATFVLAVLMLIIAPVWSVKWWMLFFTLCLSLVIAIPRRMRTRTIFSKLTAFPALTLRMMTNIRRIDRNNQEFIHTSHDR